MKNILIKILSIFLVIHLSACGGGSDSEDDGGFGGVSLKADATSSSVIELSWSEPGNGFSTSSYNIAEVVNNSSYVIGNTTERRYTVAGLLANTRYCYVIKVPLTGNTMSNTACATTSSDTTPPTTPTGLSATAISPAEVQLTWNNSSDAGGSINYNVYRDGTFLFFTGRSEAVDDNAISQATHCYRVSAVDEAGNASNQSAEVCVVLPEDTENPTVPTELTVEYQVDSSPQQFLLSWRPASDDGVIRYYNIYRNGTFLTNETSLRYYDTDLLNDTSYCYTVSAVDTVGKESGQSEEVCALVGFQTKSLGETYTTIAKMSIDSTNEPIIAYKQYTYDNSAAEIRITLNLIRPNSITNPLPQQLESSRETWSFSDAYRIGMAIDNSDTLHFLHKVNHPAYGEAVDYIQVNGSSQSKDSVEVTEEFLGTTSMVVDTVGTLHACYDLGYSFYYASNTSGVWNATDMSSLVAINSGNSCDITVDSDNNVHISFLEDRSLKYISNKTGAWEVQTIDLHSGIEISINSVTSIATDPEDHAHIAYYHDYSEKDLEYATNASGSWSKQTLDSVGDVGYGCDLAIDSMGYIHISYMDMIDNNLLKYATNSSGVWNNTVISNGGISNTSLAIDSNDRIHIAFTIEDELAYTTNSSQ